MKITRKSLAARLLLSAMVVSLVLLLLAGGLLFYLFKVTVERNFDARLEAVMNGLLANLELDEKGRPYMHGQLADPRFGLPASGWYWRIAPVGGKGGALVSKSLLDMSLDIPAAKGARRDSQGVLRTYLRDANGVRLRILEQRYTLYDGRRRYSVLVAGNFDELRSEMSAFAKALVIVLALLGAGLMAAMLAQVRYGLRPLKALHDELGEIREGRREELKGEYPAEIEHVAQELNLLIRANREIVERARTQVGNLAHALKTPLSVLNNEARTGRSPLAKKVLRQTQVMRDQISIYLDRARRAARATGLGAVTPVEEVVSAIVRTLERINSERSVSVNADCPGGLKFRGERQDLEEMIGNLLDNAFKYAKGRIDIHARIERDDKGRRAWVVIIVDDDGPGLPEKDHEKALKRGQRLDETRPGSGLGLSIVHETASMYHGRVILGRAPIGGLRVSLRLPAASAPK